jgi:3-hydroxybutyryl-CoA dehydrogenase
MVPAPPPRRRQPRLRAPAVPPGAIVALHGRGVAVDRWAARLEAAGVRFEADPASRWNGLQTDTGELRLGDGRPATAGRRRNRRSRSRRLRPADRARRRRAGNAARAGVRGERFGRVARARAAVAAHRRLAAAGRRRRPGLVVARTVAMLINEGADAVQQGVCTPKAPIWR